jgi:hypothetical protein
LGSDFAGIGTGAGFVLGAIGACIAAACTITSAEIAACGWAEILACVGASGCGSVLSELLEGGAIVIGGCVDDTGLETGLPLFPLACDCAEFAPPCCGWAPGCFASR